MWIPGLAIFREMTFVCGRVAVDSNPEVFVFVLTQNGEECSVVASVLVALLAPGNLEVLSRVSRGWR